MKFTKMHGCGNDYVYVNCLEEKINNPNKVAKFISDRHFGIGSDGMICICPSDKADFRMAMYNSDGSEGAMCGNGVRCIAKYVYDYGLTDKTTITIETKGGIKELDLTVEDGKVTWVKVDMEAPITKASQIPAIYDDLDKDRRHRRHGGRCRRQGRQPDAQPRHAEQTACGLVIQACGSLCARAGRRDHYARDGLRGLSAERRPQLASERLPILQRPLQCAARSDAFAQHHLRQGPQ